MARETGGRAYVNQNEIKDGVAQAFADQSAVYTLGYYPENKKYDGQYRSIKVKLNKPGLEIFQLPIVDVVLVPESPELLVELGQSLDEDLSIRHDPLLGGRPKREWPAPI